MPQCTFACHTPNLIQGETMSYKAKHYTAQWASQCSMVRSSSSPRSTYLGFSNLCLVVIADIFPLNMPDCLPSRFVKYSIIQRIEVCLLHHIVLNHLRKIPTVFQTRVYRQCDICNTVLMQITCSLKALPRYI